MLNKDYITEFNTPIRTIKGKVELFNGSTLLNTFNHNDCLKSITIDRQGEKGKFFGFGVAQKATVNILDKDRAIEPIKDNHLQIAFKINDNEYVNNFTNFYISDETKRNENTNELTIIAYDALYAATAHVVAELNLQGYSIKSFVEAIGAVLGVAVAIPEEIEQFNRYFDTVANFDGTESFRAALDDAAEATQTIYYMSGKTLVFKRLGSGQPHTIEKKHYFTLTSENSFTLGAICNANELGDNITHTVTDGVTQYIRDNAFLVNTDGADIIAAAEAICGLTITPFVCSWRGNYLTEIGDNIAIVAKDNSIINSYILCDTISYSGGFSQKTEWSYEAVQQTASNPATLGEVLKLTSARVDKVNKEIELVASETAANKSNISTLLLDTDSIRTSVESIDSKIKSNEEATAESIESLKKQVEATMTDEEVQLAIKTELDNGTSKVTTTTGFTFNDDGLTVNKSGSEISTTITENGMAVAKSGGNVLVANNEGVTAIDLHAKTFLIIGTNSRLEDYKNKTRTACFWIGG